MVLRDAFRSHWPFIVVFFIALFLRLYKLPQLTTFGRDQGIDFLSVKEMIDTRKPTLLGIKVSIADFHQGPVYLYILVPLFAVMNLHPIAGAYTAVIVSCLTLVILYVGMTKFFGKSEALWSSVLFAVSPEFVRMGVTPLYQHFLPLFLVLGTFTLLAFTHQKNVKKKSLLMIGLGLMMGISLELHFLAITSCVVVPIYMLIRDRKDWRYVFLYGLGLLIGVSPTIAFELRHEFLNTHLFWAYLTNSDSGVVGHSVMSVLQPWVMGMAKWYGADKPVLGGLALLGVVVAGFSIRFKDKHANVVQELLCATTIVTILFQLALRSFEPHYELPIWILLAMMAPLWLGQLKKRNAMYAKIGLGGLIFLNAVAVSQAYATNYGYSMPNGWTLEKIIKTSDIISSDAIGLNNVNVASLLDGDTRAYPLRYTLAQQQVMLDSEEKYPESTTLYVVTTRNEQELHDSPEWEVFSLEPFSITKTWDLEDDIKLYRVTRNPIRDFVIID